MAVASVETIEQVASLLIEAVSVNGKMVDLKKALVLERNDAIIPEIQRLKNDYRDVRNAWKSKEEIINKLLEQVTHAPNSFQARETTIETKERMNLDLNFPAIKG